MSIILSLCIGDTHSVKISPAVVKNTASFEVVTAVLWVKISGNTYAVTQHYNPDNTLTPTHTPSHTPTLKTPGANGIHVMWLFCEQIHCVQQRTIFLFMSQYLMHCFWCWN
jgi:hypothetical protein